MAMSMESIATKQNAPHQRVDETATSKGVSQGQRVGLAPPVTMTMNPTAPVVIQTTPQTHQRNIRHNTPGITSAIEWPTANTGNLPQHNPAVVQDAPTSSDVPNSNYIPSFSHHTMIPQEALNMLTQSVRGTPGKEWTPRIFLGHSPMELVMQDNFH